jgi:hypothetical protein
MKIKNISLFNVKLTSIVVANGIILCQIAPSGMAQGAFGNVNGANLPSNAGSFRDPGFIEPLGSQQFFKDNSYFIENNNASEIPKDNPLTIKDENLAPEQPPNDRSTQDSTQDSDRPPQLPKNNQE